MLLFHIVHEEDPAEHHHHLYKGVVEEMQTPCKEGDEDLEDDAVVHGIAVVKVDKMLLRPKLAHSALAVASTDTMHRSVLKARIHPAVVVLHSL